MKKLFTCLMTLILIIGGNTMTEAKSGNWDKTFSKSDKVNIEKVHFKNRYGINLTGDLYTPKKQDG